MGNVEIRVEPKLAGMPLYTLVKYAYKLGKNKSKAAECARYAKDLAISGI